MSKHRPPINTEPINKQARSDIASLIEDLKIPACVEHTKRFARLPHGKRGILPWLEHLRLTGLLLSTLDDEEWSLFTAQYLKEHTEPKAEPQPQPKPAHAPVKIVYSDKESLF